MRYIYLVAATYVLSLVLGAVAAWMITVSPWGGPMHYLANWLLEFEAVKSRYDLSVSFCGYCGDLYLLTAEFFLVLTMFYLSVLAYEVIGSWFKDQKILVSSEPAGKLLKIIWLLLFLSALFFGMLWSLLFLPGFARPSHFSPSSSEFSMFGFTLIFLTTTAFHILALTIAALVLILRGYLQAIRMAGI